MITVAFLKQYGISWSEYWHDIDLRHAVDNVFDAMHVNSHPTMDARIKNVLDKRAGCGGLSVRSTLDIVLFSDRGSLVADVRRRTSAQSC